MWKLLDRGTRDELAYKYWIERKCAYVSSHPFAVVESTDRSNKSPASKSETLTESRSLGDFNLERVCNLFRQLFHLSLAAGLDEPWSLRASQQEAVAERVTSS